MLYNEILYKILSNSKGKSISEIGRISHLSWGCVFKNTNYLVKTGYINLIKSGRQHICVLSDKGKKALELLKQLEDLENGKTI